jgi:hypothetical protein
VARNSKLFTVKPVLCESSVSRLLYVTLLAPTILRWLLDVREICGSLIKSLQLLLLLLILLLLPPPPPPILLCGMTALSWALAYSIFLPQIFRSNAYLFYHAVPSTFLVSLVTASINLSFDFPSCRSPYIFYLYDFSVH